MRTKIFSLLFILITINMALIIQIFLGAIAGSNAADATAQGTQIDARQVYLPLIFARPPSASLGRLVNAPHFAGNILIQEMAIFWFGRVNSTSNYADVRVGYNDSQLFVVMHIFDRRLWYNRSPSTGPLTAWDSTSLYLNLDGNTGSSPGVNSYRFDAQLNSWEPREKFQAAYRGDGSKWTTATTFFTTASGYRGNAPNDNTDDSGWTMLYYIPFTSLGLSDPPAPGTHWGLAVALHDRDDAAGTAIPDQTWPEKFLDNEPVTWGQLSYGLPVFKHPAVTPKGTVTIQQGLNGAVVPDAAVGGTIGVDGSDRAMCPTDSYYIWNQWANTNFGKAARFNIQNEYDVSDWPCFAKYYVTFPLSSLPTGKVVISATLTLHKFGNSGQPGQAKPSLIQVSTVPESWSESTITWNNAPLAGENVSQTWVEPLTNWPGWPGVPWSWDVSAAVAQASAAGKPLSLVLYEADYDYHSGKYFMSSDEPDWDAAARPKLEVLWGDP